MKKGDIVVSNFMNKKIDGQHWVIIGKDFCSVDCFCLKNLGNGKYLTLNKAWLRRKEHHSPSANRRKVKTAG